MWTYDVFVSALVLLSSSVKLPASFVQGLLRGGSGGEIPLCSDVIRCRPLCSLFCFVFAMECNDVIGSQADADVFSDRMVMVAWHQG